MRWRCLDQVKSPLCSSPSPAPQACSLSQFPGGWHRPEFRIPRSAGTGRRKATLWLRRDLRLETRQRKRKRQRRPPPTHTHLLLLLFIVCYVAKWPDHGQARGRLRRMERWRPGRSRTSVLLTPAVRARAGRARHRQNSRASVIQIPALRS